MRQTRFSHPVRVLAWIVPASFLALMLAVPVGRVIQEALFPEGTFSLAVLGETLRDRSVWRLARFTAWQAGLSALASAGLGFVWAYVLTRFEFPFKRTLRTLTIVPFVLPAVSLALGFVIAFGRNGLLNRILMGAFGLDDPPVRILYSLGAIVLAHAFYNAPIVARLTHAAWERIDSSYEESAQTLGAGVRWRFASVTLPLLAPAVLTGTALAFIYSFLSFPIVLALGGAQYATLEVGIYIETLTLGNLERGAALALIQIALSLAFTLFYLWLERRYAYSLEQVRPRPTERLFRWILPRKHGGGMEGTGVPFFSSARAIGARLLLLGFLALSGLFFASPFLGVLHNSLRGTHGGWTLSWYGYIVAPDFNAFIGSSPLDSVLNSLGFGLGTLALALCLGAPLAWAVARRRVAGLNALAMLPLAISSVALGFGLLRAFAHPPLDELDRGLAVVMAHALLALPFVVRALVPAVRALDPALVEAARGLGARRLRVFASVELPLLRGAALAAAAFAFAISIGEMSATLMLAQPGLKTMPVSVYSFLGARLFGAASAMSVVLIAVTALSFVLIERAGERVI